MSKVKLTLHRDLQRYVFRGTFCFARESAPLMLVSLLWCWNGDQNFYEKYLSVTTVKWSAVNKGFSTPEAAGLGLTEIFLLTHSCLFYSAHSVNSYSFILTKCLVSSTWSNRADPVRFPRTFGACVISTSGYQTNTDMEITPGDRLRTSTINCIHNI